MDMKVVTVFVVCIIAQICCGYQGEDNSVNELAKNKLLQGAADVVFLLDRSGSVGLANFEMMKGFVESLLMHVVVDVNATRVAVISYSSTVKLHINYIRNPKSKCFFAMEMLDVVYEDVGATNIAAALEKARKVLLDARPNVNKVVILISDGLATLGPDPIPVAKRLRKESKAEVFTLGIGKFLQTQLKRMATSPEHHHACVGFVEFKRLAKSIRGDPHESKWSDQASSTPSCDHLCNSPYRGDADDPGCCDHYADCSCALLSGTHTCVCRPGYFGLSGTWGKCRACPRGTYKSRLEPSSGCTPCPPFSTTLNKASTSFEDCLCQEGYIGNLTKEIPCEPVRCPPLQDPTNGGIVGKCYNYFSSTCFFMCNDNYELVDQNTGELTCQSNGVWSQNLPVCQKIRCSPLHNPQYGYISCSESSYFVGTVCTFSCPIGYILKGSNSRQCLPNKQWSGFETMCIAITCPIPSPLINGIVESCDSNMKPFYGTTCVFQCNSGYKLNGPGIVMCNEHGILVDVSSNEDYSRNMPNCQDIQPPVIKCPKSRSIPNFPGSAFAKPSLEDPYASDNSGIMPAITSKPTISSQTKFGLGKTTIMYQAKDYSGNVAECSTSIEVFDDESPKVIDCPTTIIVNVSDTQAKVFWEEPLFHDNSQQLKGVKSTAKPGSIFSIGRHSVSYFAADMYQNRATCTFDVIVTQNDCPYFPPPINGALACEDWMFGQFCQAYCEDKYDFVDSPAEWYVCNDEANWQTIPEDYPVPWPDCLRKKLPNGIRQLLHGFYYFGNCNDSRVQHIIKKVFLHNFRKQFPGNEYCKAENSCMVESVTVKCGPSIPDVGSTHVPPFRFKRDIQSQETRQTFDIELDFIIDSNTSMSYRSFEDLFNSIENLDWNIDDELDMQLSALDTFHEMDIFEGISQAMHITSTKVEPLCPSGAVLKDHLCMFCTPGSFHDSKTDECVDCPIGYYQENEGQVECIPCPRNMSTITTNAKNKTECKGICMEGTYSINGLETCIACPVGTFQDQVGQTSCNMCPNETTTISEGSAAIQYCLNPCPPGTYSVFGFEPCESCSIGFYQASSGQTTCDECSSNLTTLHKGSQSSDDCIEYDHCVNGTICKNGGICINVIHETFCQCMEGYYGKYCEFDIDECSSHPCLNDGSCLNLNGSFSCECSLGFEGALCEIETDECKSEPCMNNGTCVDQYASYLCICAESYSGKNCEKHLSLCTNNVLCLNGGYCSEKGVCLCPNGFTGLDCSINLNECHEFTCQNGGSCSNNSGDSFCICAAGYTGSFCEVEIDECSYIHCYNGATCLDFIGYYKCVCSQGWSGELCDQRLSSDFILSYPEDSSIENMASSSLNFSLQEGTLSLWVQTTNMQGKSSTPVSYAAFASAEFHDTSITENNSTIIDNALTISDCSDLTIYVNNRPIYLGINIADGGWHHLGFTWTSSDSGKWDFYKDGELLAFGKDFPYDLDVPGGGQIVVGQEQDNVGGGFTSFESFTGNITRLNIWNKYFPNQTIGTLCNLRDDIAGKVVAWTDFRETIKGNVQLLDDITPKMQSKQL